MWTSENNRRQDACTPVEGIKRDTDIRVWSQKEISDMLEACSIGPPVDAGDIEKCVEDITVNIRGYKDGKYLMLFQRLKKLCVERNLTLHAAKMDRNIAMNHFYRNNSDTAIGLIEKTILFLEKRRNTDFLFICYSDLGLINYYIGEYMNAKSMLEKAAVLLPQVISQLSNDALHCYYYRQGLLYDSMLETDIARQFLQEAEKYATNKADKGLSIMNIGMTYRGDRDFSKAFEYFNKALDIFGEDCKREISIVYNNMADVYNMLGQYDKAMEYINMAFELVDENNQSHYFIFFGTYTEIKVLKGEHENIIDKFFDLLSNIKNLFVWRKYVIEGINNIIIACNEDVQLLERLEEAIKNLIADVASDNGEYKQELKKCLNKIEYFSLENDKNQGGNLYEEEIF